MKRQSFEKSSLQVVLSEYLFNIKKFDTNFFIAKIMLDRLSEFPNISIEKIAYLANTTPATVTKFCKKIGYDGFHDIKRDSYIESYSFIWDYIDDINKPIDFFQLYTQQIKNIYDNLYEQYNHSQIERIAFQLSCSQKITVLTGNHGFTASNLFSEMLRPFHITNYVVDRHSDISIIQNLIHQSDMIFIISLSGKWMKRNFMKIDTNIIERNKQKIVVLSFDSTISEFTLVDFSFISKFFDSTFISSNAIQVFFILVVSYLATMKNQKNEDK